jgi:hypothetical protein
VKTFEARGVCGSIIRGVEARGRRLVWWAAVPRWLTTPSWWRWTIELGYAIAADYMAWKVGELGVIALYPPRLS